MKLGALLSTLLVVLAATPASAQDSSHCGRRNSLRYCNGTNYNESLLQTYLCGDRRLGPTRLPSAADNLPVAPVLAIALFGYDRFAGLCPGAFLERWINASDSTRWKYPPQNGFLLAGPDGERGPPIQGNVTLAVDTLLDRFGGETNGTFVSPAGAPYAQRALPPGNLVARDEKFPYNYHIYSVVRPLLVLAGPIRPWFGQPGAGVQYMLYNDVATLISQGYLRREDPSVLLP
ncbi:hypothetical protein C7999DRAFT_31593 [Corynascus novoguineensis]|uniref:TNT domain-containing protein n=1 Tax=Corynascus novoguineensis TaxID=1126955 RepID=A0AAN7CT77_9PEZI|nr:hypothetical protein C7999DRAFT_31593 [Corynascus novoguineensis]